MQIAQKIDENASFRISKRKKKQHGDGSGASRVVSLAHWCHSFIGVTLLVVEGSLLQNIVSFIGLFCKRDMSLAHWLVVEGT